MNLTEKARMHLTNCGGSKIPFLQVYNVSDKTISMPQEQTPYIYFVLAGELRLYTSGGIMDYVTGQGWCFSYARRNPGFYYAIF